MTYQQLSKKLYANTSNNQFFWLVGLETKHKGYLTLIHWLKTHDPTKIMGGICQEAYSEYMLWCDDQSLPFLKMNSFTRYLATYENVFVKIARINGDLFRVYYKAMHCPTCGHKL